MAAKIEIVVEANVNQFTPAMNKAGQALTNLQKNSNSAQLALVNLGRVAQDAPYGFIGIANNLNPLLEGFQRLKSESGSTGGALKALGSSLMGAGGIGIALSLVTAAVSFASIGFSSWTSGLKSNGDQLDENAEKLKKNADAYKSIVSSIAEEVASVSVLIESFKKENISRKEKQNIIEQLQKLAPEYFGNLDKEKATIEDLTNAYNNYSASILRSVELKVRQKQLEDVIKRRIELQDKSKKFTNIEIDDNGKLKKSINAVYDADRSGSKVSFQNMLLTQAEVEELNSLLKTEKELLTSIGTLKQPQDFLKTGDLNGKAKDIETIQDVFAKLNDELIVLTKNEEAFGVSLNSERINKFKSAITE